MLDKVVQSLMDIQGKPLNLRDHSEREQALLDLLTSNKLTHLNNEEFLHIALESKCYRVAEHIYLKTGEYANILTCYLKDPIRKSEVFNYILTYINVNERCIKQQFLVNFNELLLVDSKKTAEIVTEHFPELLDELCAMVESDSNLQYTFLKEIVYSDVKIAPELAEKYLELLCARDKDSVYGFVNLNLCRVDIALKITEKFEVHAATALLLEQGGEWPEALDLLLKYSMIKEAISLCIRGAEHLDSNGAQQLWLKLLQNKASTKSMSLRQLLHAAAPHVPPAQLLELISDASLGDTKLLLYDMLADCKYDIQMLQTALKILGKDLHYGKYLIFCM